jgi:hypothetical protein
MLLESVPPHVTYLLFAAYVVAGLWAYERWGLRLGGVLALPYLVVYALEDLRVLLLFGLASAVTYLGGEAIHRYTLIYGRRMLVAFLLLSLVASYVFNALLSVSVTGVFLPVLPGLFAYNLHREGRPVWHIALFIGAVSFALLVTFALLTITGVVDSPVEQDPTLVSVSVPTS